MLPKFNYSESSNLPVIIAYPSCTFRKDKKKFLLLEALPPILIYLPYLQFTHAAQVQLNVPRIEARTLNN